MVWRGTKESGFREVGEELVKDPSLGDKGLRERFFELEMASVEEDPILTGTSAWVDPAVDIGEYKLDPGWELWYVDFSDMCSWFWVDTWLPVPIAADSVVSGTTWLGGFPSSGNGSGAKGLRGLSNEILVQHMRMDDVCTPILFVDFPSSPTWPARRFRRLHKRYPVTRAIKAKAPTIAPAIAPAGVIFFSDTVICVVPEEDEFVVLVVGVVGADAKVVEDAVEELEPEDVKEGVSSSVWNSNLSSKNSLLPLSAEPRPVTTIWW